MDSFSQTKGTAAKSLIRILPRTNTVGIEADGHVVGKAMVNGPFTNYRTEASGDILIRPANPWASSVAVRAT